MDAPFTVFAVRLPDGCSAEQAKEIGISLDTRNGFLFKGKKSLYGKMYVKRADGGEDQFKIMVLKNKFYKGEEVEGPEQLEF